MKILIYSDIHLHDYKNFNTGNYSRLKLCLQVLEDIYAYAHTNEINTILFAGDLFDSPRLLHTVVVNESLAAFSGLAIKYPNIKCYAISGNHDHSSKNLLHKPAVTALTAVAEIIPNHFEIIDNKHVRISDNVSVYGIPYYEYKDDYQVVLQQVSEKALLHKQQTNDFQISLIHQTPNFGHPHIPVDTDANDKAYDPFDEVFCGHIHHQQEITPKFSLVGNPNHRDLGDAGKTKGFYVLDTDTRKKQFISNKGKYPEYQQQKIQLGEHIKSDGFNFIVPEIVGSIIEANSEGVDAVNFDISLEPQSLIINYAKEVAPDNDYLLEIGLECLGQVNTEK